MYSSSNVEGGKEKIAKPTDTKKEEVELVKDTKSIYGRKIRFMGKRSRPRKKSNANSDQVRAFEDKIKGCHK